MWSIPIFSGLRQEIENLPQNAWNVYKEEKRGMIREWTEVPYRPTRQHKRRIASLIDTRP